MFSFWAASLSLGSSLSSLSRLLFLCFFQSVGVGVDGDNFGVMDESVHKSDNAGGGGEDLAPLAKGFVGGQEDGLVAVAAGDDLEEQIGVAVVVREVSEFVDGQKLRSCVVGESALQSVCGLLGGEIIEHLAGSEETCGGAA